MLLDGAETDAVDLAEQGCVVAPQRRGGGGEMRRQIFDVTDAERVILLDYADSGTGRAFSRMSVFDAVLNSGPEIE